MMKIKILKDKQGVAALEFAIILPLLLVLLLGVIEFGTYFLKAQVVQRTISKVSNEVQKNILIPKEAVVNNQGLTLVDFDEPGNFICAQSYADAASANNGSCNNNTWELGVPDGLLPGKPYYVAIRAFAAQSDVTPLAMISDSIPPDFDVREVIFVNLSKWQEVALNDSDPFDVECEYRMRLNKLNYDIWGMNGISDSNHYIYLNLVRDNLIGRSEYNVLAHIKSDNKTRLYHKNGSTGTTTDMYATYGNIVTNIQRKCE